MAKNTVSKEWREWRSKLVATLVQRAGQDKALAEALIRKGISAVLTQVYQGRALKDAATKVPPEKAAEDIVDRLLNGRRGPVRFVRIGSRKIPVDELSPEVKLALGVV